MTAAERVAAHASAARAAGKRRLSAWVDADVYEKLTEFAKKHDFPIAEAIAALVENTQRK